MSIRLLAVFPQPWNIFTAVGFTKAQFATAGATFFFFSLVALASLARRRFTLCTTCNFSTLPKLTPQKFQSPDLTSLKTATCCYLARDRDGTSSDWLPVRLSCCLRLLHRLSDLQAPSLGCVCNGLQLPACTFANQEALPARGSFPGGVPSAGRSKNIPTPSEKKIKMFFIRVLKRKQV